MNKDLMKEPKVLSYCIIANPPIRKPTDYNKLMTDFLASNKSEEYKRSILSLLDGGLKDTKKHDKKLSEMNKTELNEIAKSLKIKYYITMKKDELIQKIKRLKK